MRRTRTGSVAVLVAAPLLLWGCGESGVTGLPPEAARVPDEHVATLVHALYTGLKEPAREVIASQDEWAAFWERLHADQHPRPPLPAVDFTQSIVIAAALGQRPSGGYAIDVDGVYRADSGLHVVVHEASPGKRCTVPAVVITPVVVLRVERGAGDVTFVERRSVHACG